VHGILTDTGGFTRADSDDFQAAAYLSRFRDAELLEQVMRQARSKQAMEIIRRALGDRVTVESFSIAGIGYLRVEDRDAVAEAADFLLTEENVHTAIVYGILAGDDQEETMVGSLRTAKFTLDPDAFIKEVFGKGGDGRYFGGGKPAAGGFAIPVGFLSGDHGQEFRGLKWQVYDAQIKYKIFAKIGAEQEVLS
jgi:nanoRNase/pAp phosphatase (c-di-AMP/oligoRNAs hydrolase)